MNLHTPLGTYIRVNTARAPLQKISTHGVFHTGPRGGPQQDPPPRYHIYSKQNILHADRKE